MINVKNLSEHISTLFQVKIEPKDIVLQTPPNTDMGEYALVCFPFARKIGKAPQQIAETIATSLTELGIYANVVAEGAFVNLSLSDKQYSSYASNYTLVSYPKKEATIVIDYVGANIGKPLHIGHLCTPSFGQPSINLLRYFGYTVHGDMHQGDWGSIFGKLITAWKKYGDETAFDTDPIAHLLQLYIQITADTVGDEVIAQECRDAFRLLSEGDIDSITLWQKFTAQSLQAVHESLAPFLVSPDLQIGEAFYEGLPLPKLGDWPDLEDSEKMSSLVTELIKKGIATKNEDGSVGIIFPKATKIPSCILQKRDGTHGYLASDLSCIAYRVRAFSPEKIVYFVDNRQALHFRQLFWIAQQAFDMSSVELMHASNGFVALPDGAMSTRTGRIIPLNTLLTEGTKRVGSILEQKGRELPESDLMSITITAIKYSFLSQDRDRDWIFEWDRVLSFEGNSGPYVQYAYVRIQKMLREIGDIDDSQQNDLQNELSSYDKSLVRDVANFESILKKCSEEYKFHYLIEYIYALSVHLNSFYANTPSLIHEQNGDIQRFRVEILSSCLEVLRTSFEILAFPIPDKM